MHIYMLHCNSGFKFSYNWFLWNFSVKNTDEVRKRLEELLKPDNIYEMKFLSYSPESLQYTVEIPKITEILRHEGLIWKADTIYFGLSYVTCLIKISFNFFLINWFFIETSFIRYSCFIQPNITKLMISKKWKIIFFYLLFLYNFSIETTNELRSTLLKLINICWMKFLSKIYERLNQFFRNKDLLLVLYTKDFKFFSFYCTSNDVLIKMFLI